MKGIDDKFEVSTSGGNLVFGVKVVPGSSRDAIAGFYDGMLKVKLSAAPEKGKANKALLGFLAVRIGVSKAAIKITSGLTNPVKRITVSSITMDELLKRLQSGL